MDAEEKSLLEVFRSLDSSRRETLLAFGEFLAQRKTISAPPPAAIEAPQPIERPTHESVVRAIKRLSATYPMLDRKKLLHETSNFVNQHIMQGREAHEVIDDIERVFAHHYEKYKARLTSR